MQLQDLPISSVALNTAIDYNPLRITPETSLLDAFALISQERTNYPVQRNIPQGISSCWRENFAHLQLYQQSSELSIHHQKYPSCVLVIDEGQLVGLLTQRDCVRFAAEQMNLEEVKAADVMTRNLITVKQSDLPDICTILNLFCRYCIHHLPILNEQGQLVGIVTPDSIIQFWREQCQQKTPILESPPAENLALCPHPDAELERQEQESIAQFQKQAQQERDFTSAILDTVESLVVILDQDGRIIRFNQACEKITHYSLAEVQNKYFWDLFFIPEQVASVKAAFEQLQAGYFPDQHENHWLTKEGKLRIIKWSNTAIINSEGRVEYIIATGIDITEQKITEERLKTLNEELETRVEQRTAQLANLNQQLRQEIQEREGMESALQQEFHLLSRIMETSPVGIVMVNPKGKIILASKQAEKVLGLAKNQIIDKKDQQENRRDQNCPPELIPEFANHSSRSQNHLSSSSQDNDHTPRSQIANYEPNPLLEIDLPFQQVMTTGQPVYDLRYAIPQPNGNQVLLSINGTPLFDVDHQLKGVIFAIEDVTERVQAELALRQSEERFRTVANFTYDWEYWIGPDGKFIYMSPSCDRATGYLAEEFVENPSLLQEIIHPDDRTIFTQHRCEDVVNQKASIIDFRIITKNRDLRWISHICQPVYGGDSSYLGIRASNRDITSRKQTEEALRESEERFRSIFNQAGVGIVQADLSGRFVLVNQKFIDIVQYPARELQQKTFPDITHPDDLAEDLAYIRQLLRGQIQHFSTEKRYIRKDGSTVWVNVSGSLIRDCGGQPKFLTVVVKDISDVYDELRLRKQTEAALRQSESTLRSFYNSAGVMMGIVEILDDNIRHISDNLTASKFFGQSPETMRYQLATQIGVPQGIVRQWIGHYRESQRTGLPVRFEYPHPTKTDIRWLSATVCPISEDEQDCSESQLKITSGTEVLLCSSEPLPRRSQPNVHHLQTELCDLKSPRFCYVVEDITERKQAEDALQQLNQQLTGWVSELRTRNREMVLLGEMSDFLQACQTVEEAYSAIATLIEPLFPGTSGGVFTINSSNHWVDAVATWGTNLTSQTLFTPKECWALRRGRLHWVNQKQSRLLCPHIHQDPAPPESLCMPMMAQGNALGILYLNSPELGCLSEAKQRLAVTVAEHLALSLANLKLHETLAQQSIRDPLTGLFNRRYMEESLEREIHCAQRQKRPLGIIMLDIDHFKRFNDTFGHEAGNAILRELGIFLQSNIRGSDIACRYGGEELILILPEASLEDTKQRAEQIRQGVHHLKVWHRSQLLSAITVSLGVSGFPEHGLTGDRLIEAADAALYRAKAEGRDRVVSASL